MCLFKSPTFGPLPSRFSFHRFIIISHPISLPACWPTYKCLLPTAMTSAEWWQRSTSAFSTSKGWRWTWPYGTCWWATQRFDIETPVNLLPWFVKVAFIKWSFLAKKVLGPLRDTLALFENWSVLVLASLGGSRVSTCRTTPLPRGQLWLCMREWTQCVGISCCST